MYPMMISRWTGDHTGGTKSYYLTMIVSGENAILLKRWGRTGTFGQFDVEIGTTTSISRLFESTKGAKNRKGYRGKLTGTPSQIDTSSDLKKELRAYWSKLDPKVVRHLDPGIDIKGMIRSSAIDEALDQTDTGDAKGPPPPRVKKPEVSPEEAYKNVPGFGEW